MSKNYSIRVITPLGDEPVLLCLGEKEGSATMHKGSVTFSDYSASEADGCATFELIAPFGCKGAMSWNIEGSKISGNVSISDDVWDVDYMTVGFEGEETSSSDIMQLLGQQQ